MLGDCNGQPDDSVKLAVALRASITEAAEAADHIQTLIDSSLRAMRPLEANSPSKKQMVSRLDPSLEL